MHHDHKRYINFSRNSKHFQQQRITCLNNVECVVLALIIEHDILLSTHSYSSISVYSHAFVRPPNHTDSIAIVLALKIQIFF